MHLSQVLAVKSADTPKILICKEVPKLHTHWPQSAISEGKMKAQETKPYTPRKYRLYSYYWSYFLLFTEIFRLTMPSQWGRHYRYLCIAFEEASGWLLCVLTKIKTWCNIFLTHIWRKSDPWWQGQHLKISTLMCNARQMHRELCPPFFPL